MPDEVTQTPAAAPAPTAAPAPSPDDVPVDVQPGEDFAGGFETDQAQKDTPGDTPEKLAAKPKDAPPAPSDKPKTAFERLQERAAADSKGDAPPAPPPETKPAEPKPAEPPAKPAEEKPAQPIVSDLLREDDVPEGEVEIDGITFNPRQFRKDFPESAYYAEIAARKAVAAALKDSGQGAPVDELRQQIGGLVFWDAVRDTHPDAKAVARSAEFRDWVKAQAPGIQRLAGSDSVEDAVAVLDAYKEAKAAKAAAGVDDRNRKAKARTDGALGSAVRSGARSASAKPAEDQDDFNAGFNL
jgi:hypothetical protein